MSQLVERMNEKLRDRNVFTEKDLIREVVDDLSRGDEVVLTKRNDRLHTVEEHHYVCLGNTIWGLTPMDGFKEEKDREWTGLTEAPDNHLLYTDTIVDLQVRKKKFSEENCKDLLKHKKVNYRHLMNHLDHTYDLPLTVTLDCLLREGKVGKRLWVDNDWRFELNRHTGLKEAKNRTMLEQELDDTLFLCKESKNDDRPRAVYTIRYVAHVLAWGGDKEAALSNGCHILANRLARGDPLKEAIAIAQKEEPTIRDVLDQMAQMVKKMYPELDKGFECKRSHIKILAMRGEKVLSIVKNGFYRLTASNR